MVAERIKGAAASSRKTIWASGINNQETIEELFGIDIERAGSWRVVLSKAAFKCRKRSHNMAQARPYTKLSDVFPNRHALDPRTTPDRALACFEQALTAIDTMNNDQREEVMKTLTTWLMTDKFGSHARGAIYGFQRYAIADCLFENPTWEPPAGGRFLGI